jgi:hypothetical protein
MENKLEFLIRFIVYIHAKFLIFLIACIFQTSGHRDYRFKIVRVCCYAQTSIRVLRGKRFAAD